MNTFQTLDDFKDLINKVYFIDDLCAASRKQKYVFARHTYCALVRNLTKLSSSRIGESINRDHATVLHSCKVHSQLMQTDKQYRDRYRYCEYILAALHGLEIDDPCDYIRQNLYECTNKQQDHIAALMREFVSNNKEQKEKEHV
tara:strand:- start:8 stop:439 length:432 start_codon:yes stop_codon:yes gene_type:complete